MTTPIRSLAEFQYEVRSLKLLLLKLKFDRFAQQLSLLRKYNADQPRIPAGQTGGGQWTDGAGAGDGSPLAAVTSAVSTILGTVESAILFVLAGGFTKDQLNMTVQDYTSQFCQGKINRVLPSEFFDIIISDVKQLADQGNAAARSCLKFLQRGEYKK